MKLIKQRQIIAELDKLGADDGYKALVLNNVSHYNELVKEHKETKNLKREYLMYQLSVQICKLLLDLKKANKKAIYQQEEDEFTKLIKGLRPERKSPPPKPEAAKNQS